MSITDLESINVLSKVFRLTGTRNFVREPFCLSEIFWHGKQLSIKRGGGGVTRTSGEIILSHNTEKICRGTLRWSRKFLVFKNIIHKRRVFTFFCRKFSVSQCRKFLYGNPSKFQNNSGTEKNMDKR